MGCDGRRKFGTDGDADGVCGCAILLSVCGGVGGGERYRLLIARRGRRRLVSGVRRRGGATKGERRTALTGVRWIPLPIYPMEDWSRGV